MLFYVRMVTWKVEYEPLYDHCLLSKTLQAIISQHVKHNAVSSVTIYFYSWGILSILPFYKNSTHDFYTKGV